MQHEDADSSMQDVLLNGQADVLFLFNPNIECADWPIADRLKIVPIVRSAGGSFFLWVDSSHWLADRKRLDLKDLSCCRFLIPSNIRYQGLERLASSGELEWGCLSNGLSGLVILKSAS